jgi:uncharacterized membrane protein YedE/YeeE
MFETFGFETLTPQHASVWFGLALGALFALPALLTGFCFRSALVGENRARASAIWVSALAMAVFGTQFAVAQGWISFAGHRYTATDIPVLAIAVGGLLFGAGMVLARGCIGRLWVLTGTGNLRALMVVVIFAITAHATLKGVLAPLRTSLQSVTFTLPGTLPGSAWIWVAAVAALAAVLVLRTRLRPLPLLGALMIGALAALGWIGTGFVLFDEFDPIALESLSFTAPMSEGLFYVVASTAVSPGFGTGLMGGVLAGSLVTALLFGQFRLQSFETPQQTLRYVLAAVLMGTGGVLAGGCTIGAGLAGIPTLGVAALLALAFIALGGVITNLALTQAASLSGAQTATPVQQPAQ